MSTLESPQYLGIDGVRTEFHIRLMTNRARSIMHISASTDESELLLPPNTRFQVFDKSYRGNGLYIIGLHELPCLFPILDFTYNKIIFPGDESYHFCLHSNIPDTLLLTVS